MNQQATATPMQARVEKHPANRSHLQNAKLQPARVRVGEHPAKKWRLQNVKLPRPTKIATEALVRGRAAPLSRTTTWDKAPLQGDELLQNLVCDASLWTNSIDQCSDYDSETTVGSGISLPHSEDEADDRHAITTNSVDERPEKRASKLRSHMHEQVAKYNKTMPGWEVPLPEASSLGMSPNELPAALPLGASEEGLPNALPPFRPACTEDHPYNSPAAHLTDLTNALTQHCVRMEVSCPPCNSSCGQQQSRDVTHKGTILEASSKAAPAERVSEETMLDGNIPSILVEHGGVKGNNPHDPSFNGIWDKARIWDGVLTWNEGEHITITITSTKTFQMHYLGKDYIAEMRNGKLHWDDDDVWTRQSSVTDGNWHDGSFNGIWNKGCIHDGVLTWNEGEHVTIMTISTTTFQMRYDGNDYNAELRDDGTLHWDDGDTWTRRAKEASPQRPVQPQHLSESAKCSAFTKEPRQTKMAPPHRRGQYVSEGAECLVVAKEAVSKSADDTPLAVGVSSRGKCVIVSRPVNAKRYQGVVSWFRGSYGWLQSPEVAARYPNRVIFLHFNDCDSQPRQGDKLSFQVSEDVKPEFRNQQVKAVCARKVHDEACVDARDFIGKTCTQQRRLLGGV